MSSLTQRTTALWRDISKSRAWMPKGPFLSLIVSLSLLTVSVSVIRFVARYRQWLALGPGGLPYNLFGYVVNMVFETFQASSDTLSSHVYDQPEKYAPGWVKLTQEEKVLVGKSFLEGDGTLSTRSGERARAKVFAIPQRERNPGEYDAKVKEAYLAAHARLGEENEDDTEWHTSVLERRGHALSIKPQKWRLHPLNTQCKGELNHIHASDLSGHAVLSFADAKEVIAKGWGERHRLSGTKRVPLGYTMMYAPRSVEEIEVFVRIMRASVEFGKSSGLVVA